ncbi:uncharacterized protein LOC115877408 [Sitophilus oryzae]|uniref:Uncharacterized protein LOC115877408 n=1 Tax=Sitophilus oryzae TaxID=7048 RepID=A0A6J2XE42_SITOR|nr:uncharacterized protein LOC115877408 [Sitophilus oryzae]
MSMSLVETEFCEIDDVSGLLLDIITNYEHLYNLEHRDYKNVLKKHQSWVEIAQMLNISVEECQKRWKALRDRYTKEKRIASKSGSEAPASRWTYYERMSFYAKFSKQRKTYTTTPKLSTDAPRATSSLWNTKLTSTEDTGEETSSSSRPRTVSGDSSGLEDTQVSSLCDEAGPSSITTPLRQGSQVRKNAAKMSTAEKEMLAVAKEIAAKVGQPKRSDPNRAFVEYVYSLLEEMPTEVARAKRKQFLRMLEEDENTNS